MEIRSIDIFYPKIYLLSLFRAENTADDEILHSQERMFYCYLGSLILLTIVLSLFYVSKRLPNGWDTASMPYPKRERGVGFACAPHLKC
jgi:hypothetical protein